MVLHVEIPDELVQEPISKIDPSTGEACVSWNGTTYASLEDALVAQKKAILQYSKIECDRCGEGNRLDAVNCQKCGREIPYRRRVVGRINKEKIDTVLGNQSNLADKEERGALEDARRTGDWSAVSSKVLANEARGIILTTAFEVAGRQIEREIEIVTAECVYGMNIFRDIFAATRDFFGGRSEATQKVLRDARKTALSELKKEALMVGADAVIAVDLDYQELSAANKGGMLMIVASGTAVKLESK